MNGKYGRNILKEILLKYNLSINIETAKKWIQRYKNNYNLIPSLTNTSQLTNNSSTTTFSLTNTSSLLTNTPSTSTNTLLLLTNTPISTNP
ncbi:hypothetical protein ABK040_005204 [Willaertia magna]